MSDGFQVSLPKGVLENVVEKAPEVIKSVADSVSVVSGAISDFSEIEFGFIIGVPAFVVGLVLAIAICAICIPGMQAIK